jgi:hypothetical protein
MYILIVIFIIFIALYLYLYRRYEGFTGDVYVGKKSFILGTKSIPFTDPDLIKTVLNQNDYTAEKKRVSYSHIIGPKNSPRFFLDEHRHNFIEDVPFSPHIILNSYDDVDVSSKISVDNDVDNIYEIDKYYNKKYQNDDDYCIRNKHLLQCILSERNYKCFGKIEFTKKECEAETDIIGNRVVPGIWDRRCVANEDCPFYKANKNYPNTFGKCNGNGYCELPKGLKRVGYRKYLKNDLPYCYNCLDEKTGKINIDKCCSKQKKPDYVFQDDFRLRHKYEKRLEENGLTTFTNDNYDKEFRELEKKLKVNL